jgi:hypothetical protein
MSVIDILNSVQFVVDKQGRQTAVQLDLATWKALQLLLEEIAEDEWLGRLLAEVKDDERLEGDAAYQAYQSYLTETQS